MQNGSSKQVRRLVAIATLAALLLTVTAASSAAPSGKAASRDDHITVGLPGIPPIFLDVRQYVAQDGGYYKHYGANVTLKQFITGVDALRAVNAGQIQAAWAPTPPALSLMAKNPQLVGDLGDGRRRLARRLDRRQRQDVQRPEGPDDRRRHRRRRPLCRSSGDAEPLPS